MLSLEDIKLFCNDRNYDLQSSRNGRWIDQKCTPDVVAFVADCILNYDQEYGEKTFKSSDIWHSEYASENLESVFMKPNAENKNAVHEYDKFFQQPMEMLSYAGVLQKEKHGRANSYKIANYEVLKYIALRERNAQSFLTAYIEKVLKDSGIYQLFDKFFTNQDKQAFKEVKEGFSNYIITNTPINGLTECGRLFTKVLNPLAHAKHSRGTEKGRISKYPITYDMLMYNRNNFRDAEKPKDMTRREYIAAHPQEADLKYYQNESYRAKRYLRIFNQENRDGKTEHLEKAHMKDPATHMHHIFPEADHPEIGCYYENIIALTPTQHLDYAHPNGNTQEINKQYQHSLLLSKADRIKENILSPTQETIYKFEDFLYVLVVGFDDMSMMDIDNMDFCATKKAITSHYDSL